MNPSSLVVLVLLALIVRQARQGRSIARSDPRLHLGSGQRFRTLLMQVLEPALALAVVGSVFVRHFHPTPSMFLAAGCGAVAGAAFGAYRARSTWVAAVPAHRGVIVRFSVESVVALGLLLAVKIVAERDLLPHDGVFPVVVVGLLTFLLAESLSRVGVILWRYRRESARAGAAVHPSGTAAPGR